MVGPSSLKQIIIGNLQLQYRAANMIIESVAVADALIMFIVGNLGRVAFDEKRFGLIHRRRAFARPRFDIGCW